MIEANTLSADVGTLRNGWELKRGKFIFHEIVHLSEDGSEDLLSVSEYYGVGKRADNIEEGDFISRAESLIGYKKCMSGDLIINIMLAWNRGLGVSKFDGIVSPAYGVYRMDNKIADPDYFHYLLRTDLYTSEFKRRSTGVIDSRLRLYTDSFMDISFILPSLEEQKRIVKYINRESQKIDTLISKKETLISLLEEKRKATISQAVTRGLNPEVKLKDSGVEWLGQVPEHWEIRSLKSATKILRGKFTHRPRNDPKLYDGPYPFIQTGDVSSASKYIKSYNQTLNTLGYEVSKEFPKGTVVMTIAANIGDIAILEFNACFPDSIIGFYPKHIFNFDYLYYLLKSMKSVFLSISTFNTQYNINVDRVGAIRIPLPPLIEQGEITKYLNDNTSKIDLLIDKLKQSIEKLKEYRSAVITAAVTGQMEVPDHLPE